MLMSCVFIIILNFIRCTVAKGIEGKIIGGITSSVRRFPHSVYISIDCICNTFCGGSILNQKIILTAGHCMEECDPEEVDALAGHSDISKSDVLRTVKDIVMHDEYDHLSLYCDIALISLSKSLPLGPYIKRIILGPRFPSLGTKAITAGWGYISEDGDVGEVLKEVEQIVVPVKQCSKDIVIKWGMMCVNSVYSDEYPDQGDSGSALVTGYAEQIGLVSMKARTPGNTKIVYTNVTSFKPWIAANSKYVVCSNG